MNLIEALTALKEGKKIKGKTWQFTKYVYLDKDGLVKDSDNEEYNAWYPFGKFFDDEWEIVETPILDEQEKKYLEDFLRPFTKRYDKIEVVKRDVGSRSYIEIDFYAFKDGELSDYTNLPYFEKTEHMYEGMKEGKCYTLEELDLFR